jgi:carbonic anhydrase
MQKISDKGMEKEHYTAEAVIVWCYDHRCSSSLQNFLKAEKISNYDLVCVAGGANALTVEGDKEYILKQILTSIKLHHTKKVMLMMHKDCGACGGSKAFGNDDKVETKALVEKLDEGKEFLKKNLPKDMPIETFIVCFDCIEEVE